MSSSDTETEAPLSQEGYQFMKTLQPNLSDEINDIFRRKVIKGEEGGVLVSSKLEENEKLVSTSDNENICEYVPFSVIKHSEILPHSGRFGFRIEHCKEEKLPSKSCNYTYSPCLNKLFVQQGKIVPLKFLFEIPSMYFEIRSYLVFKEMNYRETVVDRCPHHLIEDRKFSNAHHVMEALGENTLHTTCPVTQKYLSILNFRNNQAACQFTVNIKFRCSSTCRGGIDRRPILLLFDLYVQNKYEGRSVLEVCICSSPGRDRLKNERKIVVGEETMFSRPKRDKNDHLPPISDDGTYYMIQVKGKENAEMMQKIAVALNAQVS